MKQSKTSLLMIRISIGVFAVVLVTAVLIFIASINTPRPYKTVNEVSDPLDIGAVWEENDLFRLRVDSIEEMAVDDSRLQIGSSRLKSLQDQKANTALVMSFEYHNINYEGFYTAGNKRNDGLFFNVYAVGLDKDGAFIGNTPLDAGSDGIYNFSYDTDHAVLKGDISKDNQYIVFIKDGTQEVTYRFTTWQGSYDHQFEKKFVYHVNLHGFLSEEQF